MVRQRVWGAPPNQKRGFRFALRCEITAIAERDSRERRDYSEIRCCGNLIKIESSNCFCAIRDSRYNTPAKTGHLLANSRESRNYPDCFPRQESLSTRGPAQQQRVVPLFLRTIYRLKESATDPAIVSSLS
jgi:hypothetical protein